MRNIAVFNNKKGQSLVEATLTLSLMIIILMSMITVGLYIFDMTVFVYSTNKALDKGVGMLSGDKDIYRDMMSGDELTYDESQSIKQAALNSLELRVFTKAMNEDNITVETEELTSKGEIKMTVRINGEYEFTAIPIINVALPKLDYKSTYIYKI